ncbi:hypothetical protein QBC35DRAFT_500641 [Podospora australis]|uniref:Uncharacterized protein n=1 Tax=Podospora australis TaxID=1536484 RepID=A0AAN7AHY7_9PEZI|nr:hypothetical protein QBC35DRAFT_500641 [Podospora australis]
MAPNYEPTFFLLKRRLPPSESANLLGRVIRRYQDPTLAYSPESPAKALTADVYEKFLLEPQHDDFAVLTARQTSDKTRFFKFLGTLSSSEASAASTTITSPRIITRRLKNEGVYFEKLKGVPETRRKLLEMCPVGDKVYLVVGTMSISSAQFSMDSYQQKSKTLGVQIPVGMIASAAVAAGTGIPLPPGVAAEFIPDAEGGVKRDEGRGYGASFSVESEKEEVFAIAVKVIRRTWKGLGGELKVGTRQPEYRGGQHFAEIDDADSESERDDEAEDEEAMEEIAAQGLEMMDEYNLEGQGNGDDWVLNPFQLRDDERL